MEINGDTLSKVKDDDIKTGTIKIPSYIKKIGPYAFSDCSKLISIDIPESVEEIGENAFSNCKNLEKVNLPHEITEIALQTFDNCKLLKNIIIPDSVIKIGNGAFYGCESLESIIIPNSVTKIGRYSFGRCHNLKTIILTNQLTTIECRTFIDCHGLKNVVIPESVKCIEYSSFSSSWNSKYNVKLIVSTTLIGFNLNDNDNIYSIKVGRTVINSAKKLYCIREKEILTEIKNALKNVGINNKGYYKNYFKYEEHESFIKMMLNELNKGVYIDFKQLLDNYMNEFLEGKGLKTEKKESHNDIPLKYGDEIKKEENYKYLESSSLQENKKINESIFEVLEGNITDEKIVEDDLVVSEKTSVPLIDSIKDIKEEPKKEIDIKEILKKIIELPKEDISLIMDMIENNFFDKNIENYINMSREEKIKFLELKSQGLKANEVLVEKEKVYKVSLKKEPIEVYKARQKEKK